MRPRGCGRPSGPGWALVGDAGSFKDPLTAHGITDALRDAELLARAAVDGSAAAFEHYEQMRDELTVPLLESPSGSRATAGAPPRSGSCCARRARR